MTDSPTHPVIHTLSVVISFVKLLKMAESCGFLWAKLPCLAFGTQGSEVQILSLRPIDDMFTRRERPPTIHGGRFVFIPKKNATL
jgi:hypothetical protein